ncbi:MAG: hypothetical protein HFH94_17820 [Lachnospiraceae bacterium]|jgi:hypothetical protein|nr:hypothetical protein [uncultured Acetatifactor sp.]MCI9221533.1 hypothetical protein [Lachnospiraceae bacterium]
MKIFLSAMCVGMLLHITGCADTAVSNSQKEVETLFLDESENLDVNEDNEDAFKESVATDTSDEITSNQNASGEIVSESAESSQVPSALIPAVMIDGIVYYLSQGYPIPDEEIILDQIDYTESEVSLGHFPEKDKESNYAPVGTPYVKYGKGYALKIEKSGWTLFLVWEDRLKGE